MSSTGQSPQAARRLKGRAAVVTGAGRGLGRAYAVELARNGCAVLVNDIDEAGAKHTVEAIRAESGTAAAFPGSVADATFAEQLLDAGRRQFGAVDVLVNNAAVLVEAPAWEVSEADIRRIVDVNVLGAWFCGVAALRRMTAAGRGVVINATSGAMLGQPGLAAYGATKGAVTSMTYAWAGDAADSGARVIGIMPVASTPMSAMVAGRPAWSHEEQPPERIAPLVAYLASDAAGYLHGQIVRHDGYRVSRLAPAGWGEGQPVAAPFDVNAVAAAFERLDTVASGRS